ncbi:hypothetical protein PIB30_032384 [Stylosanthes scabra]|uniref:Uncharacterized protein n=1 Tax=Stylosanthes scabra TaxID=79078 RepID=A0ABU6VAF8_9FABA|nr:hypothetical protein [Stylosanthes scabra]
MRFSQTLLSVIEKSREDLNKMRLTHCDRQTSVFSIEELEELHGSFGQLCGRERGMGSNCRFGVRYAFRVQCISGGVPANPGRTHPCVARREDGLCRPELGMTWTWLRGLRRDAACAASWVTQGVDVRTHRWVMLDGWFSVTGFAY